MIEAVLREVPAAPTAAPLGVTIARGLVITQAKRPLAALVLLVLGAAGAGLIVGPFGPQSSTEAGPGAVPIASAQPARDSGRRERLDLHGDPLPDGAVARLGTSRFNHGNNINGVAYTPDGKSLLSFGGDGFVRVWDPSTGRLLRTLLRDGSQGARLFALSVDGRRLMTGERSPGGTLRLWDFESGRELRRAAIPRPGGYFSLMSYSPDGRTLATALFDNAIVLLDVETLAERRRIPVRAKYLQHIAFSPDGRSLAGTGMDELPHRGVPGGMGGEQRGGMMRPARVAPDPSEKASLFIWDVARAGEVRRIDVRGVHPNDLAFSRDGKSLVAPFCDGTIRFLGVAGGREEARLTVEGIPQRTIAISSDGKTLASGDDVGGLTTAEIHLWDVARRVEIHRLAIHHDAYGLAFSPDGKTLASVDRGKVLRRRDVATGREIDPVPSHRSSVACLVVSSSDNTVITGGYDNAIRKWDSTTGRELAVLGTHPGPVYDLAVAPDGRFLLSSDIGANVRLWDIGAGRPAYHSLTTNPESRGRGLAISPDGRLAAASGKVADVATAREVATLLDEEGKPFLPWAWASFTPDSTGLVATDGSEIWLWNAAGGKPVRKVAAPGSQIMSVAVSPDGRFLAVGANEAVRLWHLATGREVKTTMRHDAGYVVAAFSPDGRLIVSGCGYDMTSDDPSVRVWEVASGTEIRRFKGHLAGVYSVSFFPDGRRVASAGSDAMAMVWDLSLGDGGAVTPVDASDPLDLDTLWAALERDAGRAYRAIWRMSAAGDRVVPFFEARLEPIRPDDPHRDTSLGPIATGDTLRRLRAIAVLDKINSPAARRTLQRLATGLDGARETRDARAVLRRARP